MNGKMDGWEGGRMDDGGEREEGRKEIINKEKSYYTSFVLSLALINSDFHFEGSVSSSIAYP